MLSQNECRPRINKSNDVIFGRAVCCSGCTSARVFIVTLQPRLLRHFSDVKSICLSVWRRGRGPPAGPSLMRAAGERLIDSLPQPELSPLYSPRLRASRSPPVRAETPCALPCRPPGIQHPGYVHVFFLPLLVKKLEKRVKAGGYVRRHNGT